MAKPKSRPSKPGVRGSIPFERAEQARSPIWPTEAWRGVLEILADKDEKRAGARLFNAIRCGLIGLGDVRRATDALLAGAPV